MRQFLWRAVAQRSTSRAATPPHHRKGLPSATMSRAQLPVWQPLMVESLIHAKDVARTWNSHVNGFDW